MPKKQPPSAAIAQWAAVPSSTPAKGDGRVINIEGDPDHVINRGALMLQRRLVEAAGRNRKPVDRTHVPGAQFADQWKPVSWDWALERIAKRVKATRDASFSEKNEKGQVVNRTTAIASVGSAAMDNEECWTYQALMRALGLVYIEHQARI
jgi:formate dehydrogenase major subunit